jgi:hypothetical protein
MLEHCDRGLKSRSDVDYVREPARSLDKMYKVKSSCKFIFTYLFPFLSIHLHISYHKLLIVCRRSSEYWTLSGELNSGIVYMARTA